MRIHGVDLVLCQPPGRRGRDGEEFKPNLAWLAKAPDVDMTRDSSSAAGGGAALGLVAVSLESASAAVDLK